MCRVLRTEWINYILSPDDNKCKQQFTLDPDVRVAVRRSMLSPCKFLSTSNYVSQSVSRLSSSLHSLERWLSYISVYHIHHLWEDGVPKGQEALSEFKMPEFNIFIGEADLHLCMGLTVNLPVGNEQRLLHLVSEENWFEQQLAVMYHFGVRSGHILQFSGILQMKADSWPLQSADSLPQCCCARFWNPNYLWRLMLWNFFFFLPIKEVAL